MSIVVPENPKILLHCRNPILGGETGVRFSRECVFHIQDTVCDSSLTFAHDRDAFRPARMNIGGGQRIEKDTVIGVATMSH